MKAEKDWISSWRKQLVFVPSAQAPSILSADSGCICVCSMPILYRTVFYSFRLSSFFSRVLSVIYPGSLFSVPPSSCWQGYVERILFSSFKPRLFPDVCHSETNFSQACQFCYVRGPFCCALFLLLFRFNVALFCQCSLQWVIRPRPGDEQECSFDQQRVDT